MAISVETALRRIRNQAALLSHTMRLAESDGEPLDGGAAEGICDMCDDMAELAERVARTFGGRTLNTPVVELEDDEDDEPHDTDEEPHGTIVLAGAKGRPKLHKQVRRLKKAFRKLKATTK